MSSKPSSGGSLVPRTLSLLSLVALAILAAMALRWDRVPVAAVPADAPTLEFSSARAWAHVERLAVAPRPTGTAANAAARQYLVDEFRALGLEPTVQRVTMTRWRPSSRGSSVRAAVVSNVLALVPGHGGEGAGPAILLMAHYDSVPWSFGAGDDASGVAAILETARTLTSGPPLARDVILLITDGEESGLWGAKAFVGEHPWASRVGVVLNVDARGVSGPALMFRTGEPNLWLARALKKAVPAPRATSLSYELFRLLPNNTDLAVFTAAGIPGMDFAFIGGHPRYHSARDTVDHLDPVSLQHQGSYLLGLARYLGDLDLTELPEELPAGEGTYFHVLGVGMLLYPSSWTLWLAFGGLVLWLVVALLGARQKILSAGRLIAAMAGLLLAASACAIVTYFAWQQLTLADGDFRWLPRSLSYEDPTYAIALILLAGAIAAGLLFLFQRSLGTAEVVCGAALLWLLAALAAAWKMPGLSYFFLWPAVFALIGLTLAWGLDGRFEKGWGWVGSALGAVPAVLICIPVAPALLEGLGLVAAAALAVLMPLFLGLLAGVLQPWTKKVPWLLPVLALLGAGIAAWGPLTSSPFDEEHPRASTLFYCLDHPAGEASWGTADEELDEWTRSYLGQDPGRSDLRNCLPGAPRDGYRVAPAPLPPSEVGGEGALTPPSLELVSRDLATDGTYTVSVRLRSLRGAAVLALAVDSLAPIQGIRVNDRTVDLEDETLAGGGELAWVLRYQGPVGEPVVVTFFLREEHPMELRLVDQTWGLPPLGPERPKDTMPMPHFWASDSTRVSTRTFF